MTSDLLPAVMSEIAPQDIPVFTQGDFQIDFGELDTVETSYSATAEESISHEVVGGPQVVTGADSISTLAGNNWTDIEYARSTYGLQGSGQTVVVIDSGIAYDHYALGRGFGAGKKVVGGWDFAENDANPYDDAPSGFHGTHVAGIVGSTDATYTGVAPGVDLVALRVFDDAGNGNFGWVESALRWVHNNRNTFANPITTVNLSLGASWNSTTVPNWAMLEEEFAQLEADGIFISVAAGNSFSSYRTPGLGYPAASPYVVPVMSVTSAGTFSTFSQRASTAIAAPGQSIVSTVPDATAGANGVPNDFASASGTSMAAPYMAGVSTLVRQAMQAFGRTNITQDMIYDHLRATADSFYDSATQANYLRVNVRRALDTLAGSDTFGNAAAAATARGTWAGTSAITGTFNTLGDKDYFSFVADRSGTMQLQATTTGQGTFSWVVGGATTSGSSLSLNVVAGQTYTIGLTNTSIGSFSIVGSYSGSSSSGSDLGTIDHLDLNDVAVAGSKVFTFRAANSAFFIIEGRPAAPTSATFDVLDSAGNVLRSANLAGGFARTELIASQGQTFSLRINGSASDIDFKFSNLYSLSANRLEIYGSSKNDVIILALAHSAISINGVAAWTANSTNIVFHGAAGQDTFYVTGRVGSGDQYSVSSAGLTLTAGNITVSADQFETTVAYSKLADSLTMNDSATNDYFWIRDRSTSAISDGKSFYLYGAGTTVLNATAGGTDYSYLYSDAGTPSLNRPAGTISTNNGFAAVTLRGIEYAYTVNGSSLNALASSTLNSSTNRVGSSASYVANSIIPRAIATASGNAESAVGSRALSTSALNAISNGELSLNDAALETVADDLEGTLTDRFARSRSRGNRDAGGHFTAAHDAALANWEIADTLGH